MKRWRLVTVLSLATVIAVVVFSKRAETQTVTPSIALDWEPTKSEPMSLVTAGSPLFIRGVGKDKRTLWSFTGGAWRRESSPLVRNAPVHFRDITAGIDGTLWAVTTDSKPVRWKGGATWEPIAGAVRDVSVGAGKERWGLDSGGQIFRMTSDGWRMQKGPKLKNLSAGSDSSVWGVGAEGEVYRRDANSGAWDRMPGELKKIVVDTEKVVAGIGRDGRIYRFAGPVAIQAETLVAAKVGSCGADKRMYGILKTIAQDCRAIGGAMNGNPRGTDWTDCHLDWCVPRPTRVGYSAARPGTCQKRVADGAIGLPAGECRRLGGRADGNPADSAWTLCHFDWCADAQPKMVAARPATCQPKRAHGYITATAGDCQRMGWVQGNPPASQWGTCHLDWCDAAPLSGSWVLVPGMSDVRSISLAAGGDLWAVDASGKVARLSLPVYAAIADQAAEAGRAAARQIDALREQAALAAQQAGEAWAIRTHAEAGAQYAAFAEGLAGALGNLGLYTPAPVGTCGDAKRGYGIIHMKAGECRRMGGNMNGSPADPDWTDCHFDWCVAKPGRGFSMDSERGCLSGEGGQGIVSKRVGYGGLHMTAQHCRRIGGAMGNPPADHAWTSCGVGWCQEPTLRMVAASPGWCKSMVMAYGHFKTTARDCRAMGGNYNGEPPDPDWIDCHFDWCQYVAPSVQADPFVIELLERASDRLRATRLVEPGTEIATQAICRVKCVFSKDQDGCMNRCLSAPPLSVSKLPQVFQQELAAAQTRIREAWAHRAAAHKGQGEIDLRRQLESQLAAEGLSLDPEKARAAIEAKVWSEARRRLALPPAPR